MGNFGLSWGDILKGTAVTRATSANQGAGGMTRSAGWHDMANFRGEPDVQSPCLTLTKSHDMEVKTARACTLDLSWRHKAPSRHGQPSAREGSQVQSPCLDMNMTLTKSHDMEVKTAKACTGDLSGMQGHLVDMGGQVPEKAARCKDAGRRPPSCWLGCLPFPPAWVLVWPPPLHWNHPQYFAHPHAHKLTHCLKGAGRRLLSCLFGCLPCPPAWVLV